VINNVVEDYCVWKGFKYCRLDGNTPHEDRILGIDEFNREGSEKFIYLLTTRAGGLGINLASADTVILYDNDWNPQVDLQAEDRAHRIGQKKQVIIFRFITENAIEEKVIDRATQKLRLDQLVIQQGRQLPKTAANKDDLVNMIQYGAESIFQSTDSTITTEGLDEILARSEKKTQELDEKYRDMGLEDIQKFGVEEKESAYQWEGEDFREKKAVRINWLGPSKRERKVNYDVDGIAGTLCFYLRTGGWYEGSYAHTTY
jgi:superfamily II DNA/RNA helicase